MSENVRRVYFIADTHFDSSQIVLYERRPFADTEKMNKDLIERWNFVINDDDIIYHLGDFGAEGREKEILDQLRGIKYLIKGNHDTRSNEYYRRAGFAEVYDKPVIYDSFWILSHEPLYVNQNMPYANIFGHVHGSPMYKDLSQQHFCACVERINYTPIAMDEIKKLMQGGK